jgi:hypothetical protein
MRHAILAALAVLAACAQARGRAAVSPRPALDVDLVAVETADEVGVILAVTARGAARAVRLVIRPAAVVPEFTLWNDLPVSGLDDGISAQLADFRPGERRRVLLAFPGMQELRAATICELELRWFEPASAAEQAAAVAVGVNVPVRSSEAATDTRP